MINNLQLEMANYFNRSRCSDLDDGLIKTSKEFNCTALEVLEALREFRLWEKYKNGKTING